MYLAEDRILCFEIVTKKREAWVYDVSYSIVAEADHDLRIGCAM